MKVDEIEEIETKEPHQRLFGAQRLAQALVPSADCFEPSLGLGVYIIYLLLYYY